jgi:hypothetical protein
MLNINGLFWDMPPKTAGFTPLQADFLKISGLNVLMTTSLILIYIGQLVTVT